MKQIKIILFIVYYIIYNLSYLHICNIFIFYHFLSSVTDLANIHN